MRGTVLALALLFASAAAAAADREEEPRIPLRGVFQAERLGGRVTAVAQFVGGAPPPERDAFPPGPASPPCSPGGGPLLRLSLSVQIELPARGPIHIENHLWMEPQSGAPCFLLRSRRGLKDHEQAFRFTPGGAIRRQREPASPREARLSPARWSRVQEHVYPFPAGCGAVLETSGLFYRLLADRPLPGEAEAFCVFHKRQVHRVRLEEEDLAEVAFDYLERKGDTVERRSGRGPARGLRFHSEPIGTWRGETEEFFRDGTRLVLSRGEGVPLSAGFEVPLLGGVDLRLVELAWE
ncbi:MAG: hypothetical protein WHT06_12715 [Desulfobacterales bacterium]